MNTSTKIASVRATALSVPASFDYCGRKNEHELGICIVEITTEAGHVGVGMTAITEESVVACAINDIAAPALVGQDALNIERVWDRLYWMMSPRGQSGYATHAVAAVDLALWDIKGQALGLPVWKLLAVRARKCKPTPRSGSTSSTASNWPRWPPPGRRGDSASSRWWWGTTA